MPTPSGLVGDWSAAYCGNHLGVDLPRPADTSVYAIADGQVRFAAVVAGIGTAVHIQHRLPDGSEITSIYYHLKRVGEGGVALTLGSQVARGTLIGYVTGRADDYGTGSHLHFGIRKGAYRTGADPRTSKWFYPGYTRLSPDACDSGDIKHTEITNEWEADPIRFVSDRVSQSLSVFGCQIPRAIDATEVTPTCNMLVSWSGSATQMTFRVGGNIISSIQSPVGSVTFTASIPGQYTVDATINGRNVSAMADVACPTGLAHVVDGCAVGTSPPLTRTQEFVLFYDGTYMFAADSQSSGQVFDNLGNTPIDRSVGSFDTCFASTHNIRGGYPLIRCGQKYWFLDTNSLVLRRWGGDVPSQARFHNRFRDTSRS